MTNTWTRLTDTQIDAIAAAINRVRAGWRPSYQEAMVEGWDIESLRAILDGHSGRPPETPGITVRDYIRASERDRARSEG